MLTPVEVEAMIVDTGGFAVAIGASSTWGLLDRMGDRGVLFGQGGGTSRDGGTPPTARVIKVATGRLVGLQDGVSMDVAGSAAVVRAVREGPGGMTLVLLAERTHVVSIYRTPQDGDEGSTGQEDEWGNEVLPDASGGESGRVAFGVAANLEPVSGIVEQEQSGRQIESHWKGHLPPGVDVRADDLILVTSGFGPPRYRVKFVAPHGSDWDTLIEIEETSEVFGS